AFTGFQRQERLAVGWGHEGQPPTVFHDVPMERMGIAAEKGRHRFPLPACLPGRYDSTRFIFRYRSRPDGSSTRRGRSARPARRADPRRRRNPCSSNGTRSQSAVLAGLLPGAWAAAWRGLALPSIEAIAALAFIATNRSESSTRVRRRGIAAAALGPNW